MRKQHNKENGIPYTQLHHVGGRGALKAFTMGGVRGGSPEALALAAFSLTKRRICKI